jgi:DNA-binding NarL/FixJ family response regulator
LTDRELQILQYLATGKSNKETAVALCISVKTVETYRSRIMLKLDAHSMSDLIHFAIRHKVVEV